MFRRRTSQTQQSRQYTDTHTISFSLSHLCVKRQANTVVIIALRAELEGNALVVCAACRDELHTDHLVLHIIVQGVLLGEITSTTQTSVNIVEDVARSQGGTLLDTLLANPVLVVHLALDEHRREVGELVVPAETNEDGAFLLGQTRVVQSEVLVIVVDGVDLCREEIDR